MRVYKTYDLINIKTPVASFRMWRNGWQMEFRSTGLLIPLMWIFYIPLMMYMEDHIKDRIRKGQ